ncbi:MAG: hypothetical protein WAU45_15680 [Blastocatellia bacterium]
MIKNTLIVLVACSISGSYVALACTCAPPEIPSQELKESDAVFSGKVIEIKRQKSYAQEPVQSDTLFTSVEVVFEVDRTWKGIDNNAVSVFTSPHSSACGYAFKKGTSYLIYANSDERSRLITTICTRTKALKDAEEDVRELGEGRQVRVAGY